VAVGGASTLELATFKNSVSDHGEFCDVDTFRSEINGLYASGVGDCPEASNVAMLIALDKFPLSIPQCNCVVGVYCWQPTTPQVI